MHSRGGEVTQNHAEEMLHGGHISIQRPRLKQHCPRCPHTLGTPHPSQKQGKRARSCMPGSGHPGLAEPCACLCQTQAAGTKEGREQFKMFLSFYLSFRNSTFLSSVTLTLPWESFLSQEEQEDMDERSACGAEPGQAEVTPGQGSSPAPSVAATAPANSAAGWPRPELGQTRLASAGKMHICLTDIPNCTSESCMC